MADLVTSAVQRLIAFEPFQELILTGVVGTDAASTDTDEAKLASAWLFQGLDDEGRPFRDPEGSGLTTVVLSGRAGEWSAPNRHNTVSFPALQALVYTDSDRNEDGSLALRNADQKCRAVAKVLDQCFHIVRNAPQDQVWPGMYVHSCVRSSRLSLRDVPTTQSLVVRGEMTYDAVTD